MSTDAIGGGGERLGCGCVVGNGAVVELCSANQCDTPDEWLPTVDDIAGILKDEEGLMDYPGVGAQDSRIKATVTVSVDLGTEGFNVVTEIIKDAGTTREEWVDLIGAAVASAAKASRGRLAR